MHRERQRQTCPPTFAVGHASLRLHLPFQARSRSHRVQLLPLSANSQYATIRLTSPIWIVILKDPDHIN
jgi:hypothetical protein